MIAQNDSSVMVRKLPIDGVWLIARTASGVFIARSISSTGVNIQKVTKAPTARKATSLTMDFGGDRQHQAVLVLGGVGLAGAEQHRERRHRQRDDQCDVADDRHRGEAACPRSGSFPARIATALSWSAM